MQELVKLLNKKKLTNLDVPIKDIIQILLIEAEGNFGLRICFENVDGEIYDLNGFDFTEKENEYIIERYDLLIALFY